jgi:hypothetical protein
MKTGKPGCDTSVSSIHSYYVSDNENEIGSLPRTSIIPDN